MTLFFNSEALIEQMRRENTHDEEQRLVIIGNGINTDVDGWKADDNRVWVRDMGGKSESGYNTPSVPYRVLAGVGYTPMINNQVWIQWEKGPKAWRIYMPDPAHAEAVGRSMHLENASDPHNQFHTTEQLLTLRSQPIGGGLANVQGYQFVWDGLYGDYKGTSAIAGTHVDLIALQPSTLGELCYSLLVFSPSRFFDSLNPIVTYLSTPQTGSLDASDIQECVAQMAPDERRIKAYRLDAGATDYRGHADDRDLRDWLNEDVPNASLTLAKFAPGTPNKYLGFDGSGNPVEKDATGGGSDTDAVHVNVPAEITAIAPKTALVGADTFLIEDSEDSDAKKSTTLDDIAAAVGGISAGGYILIQDQKTAGTSGGAFTAGADRVRVLNTIVADTVSIGSLSSNQFTLPAGTYRVYASAPGYSVEIHQAYLYNVTDGVDAAVGTTERSSPSGPTTSRSVIETRFTIASSKAFEIRHRCQTTNGTNGFGIAVGFGRVEVYTTVRIEKE